MAIPVAGASCPSKLEQDAPATVASLHQQEQRRLTMLADSVDGDRFKTVDGLPQGWQLG